MNAEDCCCGFDCSGCTIPGIVQLDWTATFDNPDVSSFGPYTFIAVSPDLSSGSISLSHFSGCIWIAEIAGTLGPASPIPIIAGCPTTPSVGYPGSPVTIRFSWSVFSSTLSVSILDDLYLGGYPTTPLVCFFYNHRAFTANSNTLASPPTVRASCVTTVNGTIDCGNRRWDSTTVAGAEAIGALAYADGDPGPSCCANSPRWSYRIATLTASVTW